MDIPNITAKQGLTEYAESLADLYSGNFKLEKRKIRGQVFTPAVDSPVHVRPL